MYQQQHLNIRIMREHRCPLKVYDEKISSKLQNWKYQRELIILNIDGNEYTGAGNIGDILKG